VLGESMKVNGLAKGSFLASQNNGCARGKRVNVGCVTKFGMVTNSIGLAVKNDTSGGLPRFPDLLVGMIKQGQFWMNEHFLFCLSHGEYFTPYRKVSK